MRRSRRRPARFLTTFMAVAVVGGCDGGGPAAAPGAAAAPQVIAPNREALIARARALELDTPYVPPPGDPLEHQTAGFAKVMCSAVFITGLDPDFAAENVGYFTGPYLERARVGKPVIDRAEKAVRIAIPGGPTLTAKYLGSQGCVTLPAGRRTVHFTPVQVTSALPDASAQPWPMGDALPDEPLPGVLDAARVKQAVDTAFEPEAGMTAALVVTWKGRLVGERYGAGITARTPLESWSMGKSVTATLMGILIHQGVYQLTQPAPIPEWQRPGDPRRDIRIADLLNMSSGLRIRAPQDPDYDLAGPYPDHLYLYTGRVNAFQYAATRPLQWPPGQGGQVSQHGPGARQLPHPPRRRAARRGVPVVSAARALRQAGHPDDGDRDGPVRELPGAGLRPHVGARLGAARQSLSAGRRLERRADPARGVRADS